MTIETFLEKQVTVLCSTFLESFPIPSGPFALLASNFFNAFSTVCKLSWIAFSVLALDSKVLQMSVFKSLKSATSKRPKKTFSSFAKSCSFSGAMLIVLFLRPQPVMVFRPYQAFLGSFRLIKVVLYLFSVLAFTVFNQPGNFTLNLPFFLHIIIFNG